MTLDDLDNEFDRSDQETKIEKADYGRRIEALERGYIDLKQVVELQRHLIQELLKGSAR